MTTVEINKVSKTFTQNGGKSFYALKDVSAALEQGSITGIIGANGAGKSTLLKILGGMMKPSSGAIIIRGEVSSVLEIGTGFHPDLSGRDNVFLAGAIAGLSKAEIHKRFDEIVFFSGLEAWIDEPVKHYSSGMYLRLAFSVVVHTGCEVLFLDEVMSVGDAAFRVQCFEKMQKLALDSGRTIVFAGHNIQEMSAIATKGLWLVNGKVRAYGAIKGIAETYLSESIISISDGQSNNLQSSKSDLEIYPPKTRVDLNGVFFLDKIVVFNSAAEENQILTTDDSITLQIDFTATSNVSSLQVVIQICSIEGQVITTFSDAFIPGSEHKVSPPGKYRHSYYFRPGHFNAGTYVVNLIVGADMAYRLGIIPRALLVKISESDIDKNSPWQGLPSSIRACPESLIEKLL